MDQLSPNERSYGRFPVPSHQFRSAFRNVPAAVGVVTAEHEGIRNGLTATAICSVSAEPAQLLVCVHRDASACALIAQSQSFAINFLAEEHEEIARLFSQPKLEAEERFARGRWERGVTGSPVFGDAAVALECNVIHQALHGTHFVFIGTVIEVGKQDAQPLLYHEGAFCRIRQVAAA